MPGGEGAVSPGRPSARAPLAAPGQVRGAGPGEVCPCAARRCRARIGQGGRAAPRLPRRAPPPRSRSRSALPARAAPAPAAPPAPAPAPAPAAAASRCRIPRRPSGLPCCWSCWRRTPGRVSTAAGSSLRTRRRASPAAPRVCGCGPCCRAGWAAGDARPRHCGEGGGGSGDAGEGPR